MSFNSSYKNIFSSEKETKTGSKRVNNKETMNNN